MAYTELEPGKRIEGSKRCSVVVRMVFDRRENMPLHVHHGMTNLLNENDVAFEPLP
ncbi:MAG: hypothetical protein AAGD14_01200 [Planctomycetota bacterium]